MTYDTAGTLRPRGQYEVFVKNLSYLPGATFQAQFGDRIVPVEYNDVDSDGDGSRQLLTVRRAYGTSVEIKPTTWPLT